MNGYSPGYSPTGMTPYGFGGGFAPTPVDRNQNSRRENDSRRQTLFRHLATAWRSKDDPRASRIEVVHVRSGTRLSEWEVSEKDNAAIVADRCMQECEDFLKGSTGGGAQLFHVIFDGIPISLWYYPENFAPGDDLPNAYLEQILRHAEGKEARSNEALDMILRNQTATINSLTEGMKQRDAALMEVSKSEVERAKLYVDLMDRRHERDLEMKKLESSEDRKDRAAKLFTDFAGRVGNIAMEHATSAMARKMGSANYLDDVASWLRDGPEKEALKALVGLAMHRAELSQKQSEGEASASGSNGSAQNGAAAGAQNGGAASASHKDTAAEASASDARGQDGQSRPGESNGASPQPGSRSPWEAHPDGMSGGLFATTPDQGGSDPEK